MSFTSMHYLLFVAVTAILYYGIPKKWKKYSWLVLLGASYFFYLCAGIPLVGFLLLTTFSTYFSAKIIEKIGQSGGKRKERMKKQKAVLVTCLLINVGTLFLLKYMSFWHWALPLGISFYTFQSMGYLVDVYWGRSEAEKNPLKFMLFVSFFPQILQGPIGRHNRLAPQLTEHHDFNLLRLEHAAQRIMWGYFLKFVLADRAGEAVNTIVSGYEGYSGAFFVVAVLMYSIQLYGDFAGGMDVVIGTAELLGITLDENFKRPYFAVSITDFWHRWHITLGTWMKDYVFYPLSLTKQMRNVGKWGRKHLGKKIGNVLPVAIANIIVFLLVGVWHGKGGKYLAYGLYNGVLISLEALFGWGKKSEVKWKHLLQIFVTFILVNISWFWDIAPDLKMANYMMGKVITDFNLASLGNGALLALGIDKKNYVFLFFGLIVLFVASVIREKGYDLRTEIDKRCLPIRWFLYLGLIFSTIALGKFSAAGFIYAQF